MKLVPACRSVCLLGFITIPAALAQAQEQPNQLERIAVVGSKAVVVKDAPISAVILNEQQLNDIEYRDLSDLSRQVPNLNILPHPNAGSTLTLFIRGIGNDDEQILQDPSVGVYFDGAYLSRSQGLASELVDIERIEVLRGPLGTLYGRNATGGAVNIIAKRPDLQRWQFEQRVTLGSRSLVKSMTRANLPLTEQWAVRLSYLDSSQHGFIDNSGSGQSRFGDRVRDGWRVDSWWQANPTLSVRVTLDRSNADDSPDYIGAVPIIENNRAPPKAGHPAVADLQANTLSMEGQSLAVEWRPSAAWQFQSMTTKRAITDSQYQDFHTGFIDNRPVWIASAAGKQEQESQELKAFWSSSDGYIEAVLGASWFRETAIRNAENTVPRLNFKRLVFGRNIENISKSLFAQLKWTPARFNRQLDLRLGLRGSWDDRYAYLDRAQQTLSTGITVVRPNPDIGDRAFNNVSPNISVTYRSSEQASWHFIQAYGYKSGGFNARASNSERFSVGFDDETLVSREVGYKYLSADQRLRLNAALFHADYESIQLNIRSAVNSFESDVLNAGEATIAGLELDAKWDFHAQHSATLGFAVLDSHYADIVDATGTDVADNFRFIGAPKESVMLSVHGNIAQWADRQLDYRFDYNWRNSTFGSKSTEAGIYQIPAYGLLSGQMSLTSVLGEGSVTVALWGKNLLNQDYYRARFNGGAAGVIVPSVIWGEPRSVGVTLTYRYH